MADEVIERLVVQIESDVSNLVQDADKGIKEAEKSLKSFEKTGKDTFDGTGKRAKTFGDVVKGSFSKVRTAIKIFNLLALAVGAVALAFKLFPSLAKKVGDRLGVVGEKGKAALETFKPLVRTVDNFSKVLGVSAGVVSFLTTLTAIVAAATALVGVLGVVAAKKIVGFFSAFNKAAIAANKQFETFATQFETLLGSAEKANQRLEELTKFGVETPFELPEIVGASRILEVFGGAALATGDSLTMIGDIAAGVNRPFKEVAFWIGRMFDALQSGRPFGEAAARLQEMGALSGKARAELERLQKEGKSGDEIWAAFNQQVGTKFAGNMARLSKTLTGIESNLIDFRDNLVRIGGLTLFEKVREAAERFLDVISEPDNTKTLEKIAMLIGEISATLVSLVIDPLVDGLENLDPQNMEELSQAIDGALSALGELADLDLETDFNSIIELMMVLINTFTIITNTVFLANEQLERMSVTIPPILNPLGALISDFEDLNAGLELLTGQDLVGFSSDLAQASKTEVQSLKELNDARLEDIENRRKWKQAQREAALESQKSTEIIVEANEDEIKALEQLTTEFLDLQEKSNEQIAANEEKHKQNILDIVQEANEERKKVEERAIEALAELEKDTAQERTSIIENARRALEKLEQDTDENLARERESFQQDELRETEDHLRDLRRLRLSFLDNLEDAVTARDARRVRDLQRQFARETQERTEDFETKQGRDREDNQQRLAEIRENEAQRSAEIMAAQAEQLEALRIHEAERRQEINNSLAEQLVAINKAAAQAKIEESQSFIERQMELQTALQKRLEMVAKELSDENEITREGAQAILETLNQFYGVGGEIDTLLEDFDARRRARAQAQGLSTNQQAVNQSLQAAAGILGSIPSFAQGGSMIATRPTLAMFGEAGPEMAQFTPMSQIGSSRPQRIQIELSGSAPPGIRGSDRDQIANVIVQAMREAGA